MNISFNVLSFGQETVK